MSRSMLARLECLERPAFSTAPQMGGADVIVTADHADAEAQVRSARAEGRSLGLDPHVISTCIQSASHPGPIPESRKAVSSL